MRFNYTAHPAAVVYGREDGINGNPDDIGNLPRRRVAEVGIARMGDALIAYADYGYRRGGFHAGSYDAAYVPVGSAGCAAAAHKAVDELYESIEKEWTRRFRHAPWFGELYPFSLDIITDTDSATFDRCEGVTDNEIDDTPGLTDRAHVMLAPALYALLDLFDPALDKLLGKVDELAKLDAREDDADAELAAAAAVEAWRKSVKLDYARDKDTNQ